MNLIDLATKYWPTALALLASFGALTTAINQIARALPDTGPKMARFKNVMNVLCSDYAQAFAELLAITGNGPRAKPEDMKPPQDPPIGGVTVGLVFLVAALTCGCAGSFEESRGSVRIGVAPEVVARCNSLDDTHRNWGATAKGAGVLAGISGLGAAVEHDDKTARLALAGAGIGMGALAAFSVVESEGAATSWARECSK